MTKHIVEVTKEQAAILSRFPDIMDKFSDKFTVNDLTKISHQVDVIMRSLESTLSVFEEVSHG